MAENPATNTTLGPDTHSEKLATPERPLQTSYGERSTLGLHAGGPVDYAEAIHGAQKLRDEKAKLSKRLSRFCLPRGPIGHFLVFWRYRLLLRGLRTRFEIPHAMFLGSDDEGPTQKMGGFLNGIDSSIEREN